ncbi:PR domain-containing protein 11-like [Manacus vitellinus]|uniref:PR domain-containing protein 11-like n=1 Tax=Manacus vitellinus TaxID=328815 RepID=UPI00115D8056|nr:PR domain-containing protein 11-like [Manacus vitellinus]
MNQNTTESPVPVETLDDVPEHVLRGLPEDVRLFPSAVDKTRLGVWATKSILKGKKFGPFVGDKKKRSQVKSNVYMWEVYYPNLGWMCVDATDPEKGNWLRYINWARSGKEQNLFPLEINRTIYYKSLKSTIAAGEELLVWSQGEDDPAIAAAIEEEPSERPQPPALPEGPQRYGDRARRAAAPAGRPAPRRTAVTFPGERDGRGGPARPAGGAAGGTWNCGGWKSWEEAAREGEWPRGHAGMGQGHSDLRVRAGASRGAAIPHREEGLSRGKPRSCLGRWNSRGRRDYFLGKGELSPRSTTIPPLGRKGGGSSWGRRDPSLEKEADPGPRDPALEGGG